MEGEISLERAIELIKQNTRRYAKRQITWFKRHSDAVWLENSDLPNMKSEVLSYLVD